MSFGILIKNKNNMDLTWDAITGRIIDGAINSIEVIAIIAGSIILYMIIKYLIDDYIKRQFQRMISNNETEKAIFFKKRYETISKVIITVVKITIFIGALIYILSVLDINIVPVVAAAGVLGFAISFGAQSLVKDMINGMFILIENQFNIGDTVELGGVKGKVEAFSLRSTVIRDIKGNVHVIPNSSITIATNVERDWSRLKVVIQIVSESDTEKAIMLTKKVLKKVSKNYKDVIIKDPKVLGVTSIENGYVELSVVGKVKRFQQYEFARKIRMYIIAEFKENHIEMPQAFLLGKNGKK